MVFALSVQPTAAMSPRLGGSKGRSPWPFFPPISLGRNGGAVVGPSCGSFASGQARKLIPSAGPPLPTTTTSLGRRGGPIGRVPGECPANDGRPQVAPTDGAPSRRAPRGKRADDIRPYGPGSCHTAPRAARQGCRALRLSPRPLEGEVSF